MRDVCHIIQIGATINNSKQSIKLLLVKVNHVCEDFILILEWPSLFFYKESQKGILVLTLF